MFITIVYFFLVFYISLIYLTLAVWLWLWHTLKVLYEYVVMWKVLYEYILLAYIEAEEQVHNYGIWSSSGAAHLVNGPPPLS